LAKQKFTHFIPRDKPKKRGPRQHKKNLNKHEKRQKNLKKEVETGRHGTQKYVIKQGENKGKTV